MTGGDWLVDERARELLDALEGTLRVTLATADRDVERLATHVIARGGKRLRPALLFLAASFGESDRDRLLDAAAALELVHVASLHHDDVMDRARTRRGAPSVNEHWGNRVAVLTGASLFTRATVILAGLGDDVNRLASRAWADLTAGQLHEAENAYNLEISIEEHLEILERKTATLFALPCHLGALLAGAGDSTVDALTEYGRRLGLAFQLIDDILDITSEADQMGKQPGTDLREGIYSLPVLIAARDGGAAGRRIVEVLSRVRPRDVDFAEALLLVRQTGAIEDARARARGMIDDARAAAGRLPASPPLESLLRLGSFVLARSG